MRRAKFRTLLVGFWRGAEGSGAVELALVLPLFLGLLLGLIHFALALYADTTIGHAAREGARFAAVRGAASANPATSDNVAAQVARHLAALDPARLAVAVDFAPNNAPGATVTVTARYALPGSALLGLDGLTLERRAHMVVLR